MTAPEIKTSFLLPRAFSIINLWQPSHNTSFARFACLYLSAYQSQAKIKVSHKQISTWLFKKTYLIFAVVIPSWFLNRPATFPSSRDFTGRLIFERSCRIRFAFYAFLRLKKTRLKCIHYEIWNKSYLSGQSRARADQTGSRRSHRRRRSRNHQFRGWENRRRRRRSRCICSHRRIIADVDHGRTWAIRGLLLRRQIRVGSTRRLSS